MRIRKNNKILGFILTILFVSAGFIFFSTNHAIATCDCNVAQSGTPTTDEEKACKKSCDEYDKTVGLANIGEAEQVSKGRGLIDTILLAVLTFVGWILNLAVWLFEKLIDAEVAKKLLDHESVLETWKVIRDICNIGFILILLFSAFSTVFQYSKYNYKNILMWLVIMALLVNFSFPISRFIIDINNVLMYSILSIVFTADKAQETLIQTDMFKGLQGIMTAAHSASTSQIIATIVFVFVLAMTVFALAIILLIRIVALMLVIIFSPIGFAGTVIGKDGGWWKSLFQYALAGPIIALVLFVSIRLMAALAESDFSKLSGASLTGSQPDSVIVGMIKFVPPVVVLWMGMAMAVKGIDGAGSILGKTQGVAKWAGARFSGYNRAKWFATKAVPGMTKAGWESFEEGVLAKRGLSPTAFIEGWKQRAKTKREEKISVATGAWRDKLNNIRSFGKYKTNFKELAEDRLDANRVKELKESSSNANYLLSQGVKNIGTKSDDAIRDWKAIGTILYSNRDQDELMGFIRNNYNEKILPGGKSFADIGIEKENLGVSGWNANNAMRKILTANGASDEDIDDYLMDVGEIAAGNKGVGYGGADYDVDGNIVGAQNKWAQARTAVAKMNTVDEVQGLARGLHRNNITSELEAKKDADNKEIVSGIDVSKEEFEKLAGEAYTVINPEFSELVRSGTLGNIKDHVGRHNPSFYQRVGDEKTIRGMKMKINELAEKGGERWDPTTNKVVTEKISEEQKAAALEWVVALEHYAKHGKKQ